MTAAAPASSIRLILSISSDRGDADGTSGGRKVIPKYVVFKSIDLPSSRNCLWSYLSATPVRSDASHYFYCFSRFPIFVRPDIHKGSSGNLRPVVPP